MKWTIAILGVLFMVIACQEEQTQNTIVAQGKWLAGDEQEQINAIEQQFRGFDMAMVETGYRYQELYWAGADENWEYAAYQLKKMKLAIDNGLKRRPKRAASAQHFLSYVIPEIKQTIAKEDKALFDEKFKMLTQNCNNCHAMEKVPFFTVKAPINRLSPIRKDTL